MHSFIRYGQAGMWTGHCFIICVECGAWTTERNGKAKLGVFLDQGCREQQRVRDTHEFEAMGDDEEHRVSINGDDSFIKTHNKKCRRCSFGASLLEGPNLELFIPTSGKSWSDRTCSQIRMRRALEE